jgi:hypothetical protein
MCIPSAVMSENYIWRFQPCESDHWFRFCIETNLWFLKISCIHIPSEIIYAKKSLKIPRGLSESVDRRRTDNKCQKKKYKGTSNDLVQVCSKINTTGTTSGAGHAFPSGASKFIPGFSGVRVTRSLVLCVCFVDRCLYLCTFFFDICCLFFFYLRILITPLVSSNSS